MRLAVIGGVAAGMSAAARVRRLDPGAEITVIERGPVASYSACGLPYWIDGRVRDWRELIARSAAGFAESRIEVRTGCEAVAIAHSKRQVRLASGEAIPYDKLIIATGARPSRVFPGAFHLNTLGDAVRLKEHLTVTPPGRATVIGGGYIGLEAVEALRANGWSVRLVTRGADLLGRGDAQLTATLVRHLNRCRVPVTLNHAVDGPLDTELVVAATGLKPETALAFDAGIELGRTGAIRVTEHLETNLHGIYAAGDCAESTHLVTGRPVWIPLGTTANKMGRIAGANASGRRERFPGVAGTAIVRVCGLGVGVTGLSASQARKEGFQPVSARIEARDKPRYFRGRLTSIELIADRSSGRLLGAHVLGDDGVAGRVNVVATAITKRMTVDEFQYLDLAYAPPFAPVWDPLLVAAQQLMKHF
ncbi:MAG: hypothetical protein FJW39_13135 [Acidobacteria bacterium]|nr:hypothetical protein [Acidobacteriota bacterium]